MIIKDSKKLYLGVTKVLRACVNNIQVWPSFYVWLNMFDGQGNTAAGTFGYGYSLAVVKLSNGKVRVAVGIPAANSNRGAIKVYEYFNENYELPVAMTFNPTDLEFGTTVSGVPAFRYGKSLAFSSDGALLAIGAPCADNLTATQSGPGFVRVLYCPINSTVWQLYGNHFNPSTKAIDTKGYLYLTGLPYLFGWCVGLVKSGITYYLFASVPKRSANDGANDQTGAITRWAYTSTVSTWGANQAGGAPSATFLPFTSGSSMTPFGAHYGKDMKCVNDTMAVTTRQNVGGFISNGTIVYKNAVNPTASDIIKYFDSPSIDNGTNDVGFNNSLGISADTSSIAIGFPTWDSNRGKVKVYNCINSGNKAQVGLDILPPAGTAGKFGTSVALNNNGTLLAVGSPNIDGSNGSVEIYKLKNNVWTSGYAQKFEGLPLSSGGFCVDLNSSGDRLYYTSPGDNRFGTGPRGALSAFKPISGTQVYPEP